MRETLRRLFRRRSLNYDRLEQVVIGPYDPYGFKGLADVAP